MYRFDYGGYREICISLWMCIDLTMDDYTSLMGLHIVLESSLVSVCTAIDYNSISMKYHIFKAYLI